MMHQATRAIYEALKKVSGLKPFTDEVGESSNVWLQFSLENGGSYRIRFISSDEDNDVSVRVFSLISLKGEQRANILPAINFINNKFRSVKFAVHKDGDVNVEYDFPVRTIDPSACAEEIAIRFVQIIKEAYPILMKAMWGGFQP